MDADWTDILRIANLAVMCVVPPVFGVMILRATRKYLDGLTDGNRRAQEDALTRYGRLTGQLETRFDRAVDDLQAARTAVAASQERTVTAFADVAGLVRVLAERQAEHDRRLAELEEWAKEGMES